jgi:hypothetical protein
VVVRFKDLKKTKIRSNLVKKKRAHPEQDMQMEFFAWLSQFPKIDKLAWHTPNQARNPRDGKKFQLMGVKPGVPDVFIAIPFSTPAETIPSLIRKGKGLFIELKFGKVKPSKHQDKMLKNLAEQGYYCYIAHSIEDAKYIVRECYRDLLL